MLSLRCQGTVVDGIDWPRLNVRMSKLCCHITSTAHEVFTRNGAARARERYPGLNERGAETETSSLGRLT